MNRLLLGRDCIKHCTLGFRALKRQIIIDPSKTTAHELKARSISIDPRAEPILHRIKEDRTRVISPSFDNIKYDTFEIEEYPPLSSRVRLGTLVPLSKPSQILVDAEESNCTNQVITQDMTSISSVVLQKTQRTFFWQIQNSLTVNYIW